MLFHPSCLLGGVEGKKYKNLRAQGSHTNVASPENQRGGESMSNGKSKTRL